MTTKNHTPGLGIWAQFQLQGTLPLDDGNLDVVPAWDQMVRLRLLAMNPDDGVEGFSTSTARDLELDGWTLYGIDKGRISERM